MNLLLVDDSPIYRKALRTTIEEYGAGRVVGEAASGEEGVALAGQLAPDVVIMDLSMPGIGGLEATRRIKSLARPPRVVVLTLNDQDDYRRAALAHGADAFLAKRQAATELPMVLAGFGLPSAAADDLRARRASEARFRV